YKPLDVECATMGLALLAGLRARYPEWRLLFDGDGGDENLKDYAIEEDPELTLRSVVGNRLLYQEGWGGGALQQSLTYHCGLARTGARVRAGTPPRVHRRLAVHAAAGRRRRRGDPLRGAHPRLARGPLPAEGRGARARGAEADRRRAAGLPQAALPARRGAGG